MLKAIHLHEKPAHIETLIASFKDIFHLKQCLQTILLQNIVGLRRKGSIQCDIIESIYMQRSLTENDFAGGKGRGGGNN